MLSVAAGMSPGKEGPCVICFEQRQQNTAARKLPDINGNTGLSVSPRSTNNSRRGKSTTVAPSLTKAYRSVPSQIVVPSAIARQSPPHTFDALRFGQIHTAATHAGTMSENQIACTETSALDGGSQRPTPSRRLHKPGIGRLFS